LFVSVRVFSLAAFGISLMVNGVAMIAGFDWPCVAALLAGWYLADFASGVVHMLLDYHPCPDGLGLADIFNYAGSRESAEYLGLRADRMGRLTALQRVAYDFASLALNALVLSGKAPGWLIALGVSLILGTAFAQHFHGSLHRRQVPRHIAVLRQLGLLMDPAAHQAHHDTLQRDFATNCGWSNPVVNRLFAALRAHGMLDDAGLEPQS
jgi:hypothetical protein